MPRFDRTGPMGRGPKTGKGAGDCMRNIPRKVFVPRKTPQ